MKLLLVVAEQISGHALGETLRKLGHDVTVLDNGQQAWDAWRNEEYPVLICDWTIPELDGPTLCRKIRAEQSVNYTYVILLATQSGMGVYVEGVDAGADDLITKPFDEELLAARLHVAQRMLALHAALRLQATHDPLTGLLNRGAILDGLERELQRASREGGCIGVIMVDIDHFKQINDLHGHLVGDAVLQESARRMHSVLRSYGQIGRYGGEEFLLVVPGHDETLASAVAERIRTCLCATPILTSAGALPVTISLGVVTTQGDRLERADQLIAAADGALYCAKHAGRNRVEVFDRSTPTDTRSAVCPSNEEKPIP